MITFEIYRRPLNSGAGSGEAPYLSDPSPFFVRVRTSGITAPHETLSREVFRSAPAEGSATTSIPFTAEFPDETRRAHALRIARAIRDNRVFDEFGPDVTIEQLIAELAAHMGTPHPATVAFRRAFDILGSLTGIALTAPFYPLFMGAIYLDSPGTPFYFQERMRSVDTPDGPVAVKYDMYKLRTMHENAEAGGAQFTEENDPRIFRVGRFFRRTRIDELLQFWNVLRGQMSIIGPRPEREVFVLQMAEVIPHFEERLYGRPPGITGLAQVSLDYLGRPAEDTQVGQMFTRELAQRGFTSTRNLPPEETLRVKLLYDLAHRAIQEDPRLALETDMMIVVRTVRVMLGGLGR